MDVKKLANKYKQYVIDLRRDFHMYPERSFEEFRTSAKIKEELDKMGIPYSSVAGTGVVAIIEGSKSGKVVALRADMDALEVNEKNDIPYKSQNEGMMHACGHDGHIAMLLGAAKILSELKNKFDGKVKLIFQPAEELAQGAVKMIEAGAMDGVDNVFGIHLWSGLPVGKVSVEDGPRMAAVDLFKIQVKGKGGHGSAPHEGIDSVLVASSIVMNLQSIASREMNPLNPIVVTVGKLTAGTRFNVLAPEAILEGTTRYFDPSIKEKLPKAMERIAKNIATSYRAEAKLEYNYATSPVINDLKCSKIATKSVKKLLGEEGLMKFEKVTGGEDFSEFQTKAPGVLAMVGIRNEEKDAAYPHHHPNFNIDEDALEIGSALYAQYAIDFLNK